MSAFRRPNVDELLRLAEQAEEESKSRNDGDLRFSKLEVGRNRFVVCPPYNEHGFYVKKEYVHWNIGEGKAICPELTHPARGHKCPVCTVIRMLVENSISDDMLKEYKARAQAYMNVLLIEVGNQEVNLSETPWMPHILRGPASLGDFINRGYKDYPDFADPAQAIVISVKKIEKSVKGKKNTSYEITWTPERCAISDSDEEAEKISAGIYDLDKIIGRWKEETWKESVAKANELLGTFNFDELEVDFFESECPSPVDGEEPEEKAAKKLTTVKPSISSAKPTKKIIKQEEESSEEEAPAPAAAPAPTKKTVRPSLPKALAAEAPVKKLAAAPLKKSVEASIVRTPVRELGGEQPDCYGHQDSTDKACGECKMITTCVVETLKRRI